MLLEVTYNDIHDIVLEAVNILLAEATFNPYVMYLPLNMKCKVNTAAEDKMVKIVNKEASLMLKQGNEAGARTLMTNFIQTKKLPQNIMQKYGIRSVGRPVGSVAKPAVQTPVTPKRGRTKGSFNFGTLFKNSITLKATTGAKAVIATEIPEVREAPTYVYQYMDGFIYDAFLKELINFLKKPNNDGIARLYTDEAGNNLFASLSQILRGISTLMQDFQHTTHEVDIPESPYDILARMSGYVRELAGVIKELAFKTVELKRQRVIRNNMLDTNMVNGCGSHAVISFNKLVILDERTSMEYVRLLNQKADYMEQQGKNSTIKKEPSAFKQTKKT